MHYPETALSGVNERKVNMAGTDRLVITDGATELFSVDSRDNSVRGASTGFTSDNVGNTTTSVHVAAANSFTANDVGKTIEWLAGPLLGRRVIVTGVTSDGKTLSWTGAEPVAPGAIAFRLGGDLFVPRGNLAADRFLTNSIVDGSTLTAAAAASCIPPANVVTLPANYWRVGRMWRLRAAGRISCVVTTPGTARFDLRFTNPTPTTVIVFDSLAIPLNIVAKVVVPWELEVLLTCRAVGTGTSANLMAQGRFLSEANINTAVPGTGPGPGGCLLPFDADPAVGTGFNSEVTQAVDLFFTQTVATGSLTVHQYLVEQLN